jgi:hypothetical protein
MLGALLRTTSVAPNHANEVTTIHRFRRHVTSPSKTKETQMVAFLVLLLIVALFGGAGFAWHFLWFVLIAALVLWAIGFLVGSAEEGFARRRWYGRWR